MPALQVREFPEPLYEELRAFAAANHRSIAQQTIAAVEQMLHGPQQHDCCRLSSSRDFETQEEIDARMAKRLAILERAEERRKKFADREIPSPVEMLAEARAERDAHFDELSKELFGGAQ